MTRIMKLVNNKWKEKTDYDWVSIATRYTNPLLAIRIIEHLKDTIGNTRTYLTFNL